MRHFICVAICFVFLTNHSHLNGQQVGERVVVSRAESPIKVGAKVVATGAVGDLFTVKSVKGNWLLIEQEDVPGWIKKTDVVPLESANPIFDRLVIESPDKSGALRSRALFLSAVGKPNLAIDDITEVMRLDGENTDDLNLRGMDWLQAGNPEQAMKDLDRAIELDPQNHLAYCNRAGLWIALDNYQEAIADSVKTIKIAPDFSGGYNTFGLALVRMGRADDAMKYLNEAIRLGPEMASPLNTRGTAWMDKREWQKAIEDFDKSLKLIPNEINALLNRGLAWQAMGELDKAKQDFEHVIRIQPENQFAKTYLRELDSLGSDKPFGDVAKVMDPDDKIAMAYLNRGLTWMHRAQVDKEMSDEYLTKAFADFEKAVQTDSALGTRSQLATSDLNMLANHLNGCFQRLQQKQFDQTLADIQTIKTIVALDAKLAEQTFIPLAINAGYLSRHGKHKEAAGMFEIAARMKPDFESLEKSAFASYEDAIKLDPEDAQAFRNRGKLWEKKANYKQALKDYDKAIEIEPNDAATLDSSAWLYATCPSQQFRDGRRAVTNSRKACELTNWKTPRYVTTYACALAESGDFENAIKWQKSAIKLSENVEDDVTQYKKYLKLFVRHQPYHQST